MARCWKCNAPYTSLKKVPIFHATCDSCQNYWHACCNCGHFTGYPTARCKVPNVEQVHDREGANFCDEFRLAEEPPGTSSGKQGSSNVQQKWNDLFKD